VGGGAESRVTLGRRSSPFLPSNPTLTPGQVVLLLIGRCTMSLVRNQTLFVLQTNCLCNFTGLDPAGVIFAKRGASSGLNPSCADLVDALHTDGLGILNYGTLKTVGHVDFYPNGGGKQPKCPFGDIGPNETHWTSDVDSEEDGRKSAWFMAYSYIESSSNTTSYAKMDRDCPKNS
jgi:Lipase